MEVAAPEAFFSFEVPTDFFVKDICTTLCRKLCHESFSRFELDHGERFAVSSARSALALPRPRLLCAQVLCRLFPPSFPLLPAA